MSIELLLISFLLFLPPAITSWVAYNSENEVKNQNPQATIGILNTAASIFTWGVMGSVLAGVFLFGSLMLLFGFASTTPEVAAKLAQQKSHMISTQGAFIIGALFTLSAFKGIVYLFPAPRQFLAKIFRSFNPQRLVHTHAFVWLVVGFAICLFQMLSPLFSKAPATMPVTGIAPLLTMLGGQCIIFI